MLIDPNPLSRGPANTQIPLSPEMAELVADLKLRPGQLVDALVTRIQTVTDAERQELLNLHSLPPKNQAQRQLQSLLQEPALKLVELKVLQRLIPALTALPVEKAQPLQVLVTPAGLRLIPPTPAPSAPLPQPAPPTPQGLPQMPQPQPATVPASTSASIAPAPASLPASPASAASSAAGKHPEGEPVRQSIPPSQVEQSRPLIAATLARTLPQAQTLPPLLRALQVFNRQLQDIPTEKLLPPLRELQTQLNRLTALSLPLPQLNPAKPELLRQAIQQSGVFYEQRMLQPDRRSLSAPPAPPVEQDIKGVLIQLQQSLSSPPPANPGKLPMPDTLTQLLQGLVQIFIPRHKSRESGTPLQQLKAALMQQVSQTHARVQTQQMRTLNSQLPDAGPQQWHMDIPLRLPDGFGNLYLQLFEPRPEPDPDKASKKERRRRQARWRVYMELELDDLGMMAAEISVQEQDLEITLWTDNERLRQRAGSQLQDLQRDLEKQGLAVRELQCSQNPPPAQKVRLDYSLIDIKT